MSQQVMSNNNARQNDKRRKLANEINGDIVYRSQGDERERLTYLHHSGKHVLLAGPPGCGKSKLALEFLNGLGVPFKRVDPGDPKDSKDLLARYIVGAQGSVRVEYQLLQAAREGLPLFLDEIGMLPPNVLSCFNSIADDQRCLTVLGETIYAAPGFWLIGTYNPPAKNFTPAFRERFHFISIGYLPADEERQLLLDAKGGSAIDADFCIRIGTLMRAEGHCVSTRVLLDAAALLRDGWPRDQVVSQIISRIDDSKELADTVLQTIHAAGLFSLEEVRRLGMNRSFELEMPVEDNDFFEDELSDQPITAVTE